MLTYHITLPSFGLMNSAKRTSTTKIMNQPIRIPAPGHSGRTRSLSPPTLYHFTHPLHFMTKTWRKTRIKVMRIPQYCNRHHLSLPKPIMARSLDMRKIANKTMVAVRPKIIGQSILSRNPDKEKFGDKKKKETTPWTRVRKKATIPSSLRY